MPVTGPYIDDNDKRVEDAYMSIIAYLKDVHGIQKFSTNDSVYHALRGERKDELKRAIWKLFELEEWESW